MKKNPFQIVAVFTQLPYSKLYSHWVLQFKVRVVLVQAIHIILSKEKPQTSSNRRGKLDVRKNITCHSSLSNLTSYINRKLISYINRKLFSLLCDMNTSDICIL